MNLMAYALYLSKDVFLKHQKKKKKRNYMDQTEAENIKKRWQEYTDKLYNKDIHDPNNHDAVITQLEPGILECEVSGP